jgi:branched-subunit amino acid ABC-type transport system permease component
VRDTTHGARRRRWIPAAFAIALAGLVALTATPATAATAPEAADPATADQTIQVWVRANADKAGIPGVAVTVEGEGVSAEYTTGPDGKVLVGLDQPGDYVVSVDETTLPAGAGRPNALSRDVQVFQGNKNVAANFLVDPTFSPGAATGGGSSPSASDTPGAAPTAPAAGTDDVGDGPAAATGDFGGLVLQKIVTGVIFGLILALAAIGLSLIYGTTGLNNFAHGELVTFGGLMAFTLGNMLGLSAVLAIPLAVILGGAFGWLQDTSLWKPLRRRGLKLIPLMIVTIGLSLVLRYLFAFIWGSDRLTLANDPRPFLVIGPISLRFTDVMGAIISIVCLLLVAYVLMRTRIGKAMRAVSDNRALAAASGINVERVIRVVWVGGAALAALAGVYVAYYQGLRWDTGASILLLIFAAVTLGGLGTAFGALVGSLVLSVFMNLLTLWIPENLKLVGALVVMILILLIRPQGILGRRERVG